MGWTDNREQGLTGRKRPCAPRSSQLQTSITMIIYPALAKCTGFMFHQRPVNRHCIGKFMGTSSQGQVGKPASHWCSPAKEERSRGKKNPPCALWKEQFITEYLQKTALAACCYFFFLLLSLLLPLLPVWMRNGSVFTDPCLQGITWHSLWKPCGALEAMSSGARRGQRLFP